MTSTTTEESLLANPTPAPGKFAPIRKSPMELIAEVPPIEVKGRVARCDGGDGALGHPAVYLNLDGGATGAKPATCEYCGLRFVQAH